MPNLINSAADLKANFASLSLNFTWANISSFAADVENDIVGEAISPEALVFFRANLAGLAGVQLQALGWLQRSVSYLTIVKWSQTALFQFEDKALYVSKSTNGAIISDKKLESLRSYCEEEGFKFLDKAIDLMENNLGQFTEYAASATREAMNQGFILSAVDFSRQRNINNSRVTFMSMYAFMIDIQEDKLPEVFTPAYYATFKTGFFAGTLITEEKAMLPFIKKAIANFTIAEACFRLPIEFRGSGIYVNRFFNSIDYAMKLPADQSRLQFQADDHSEKGESFLQQLQDYITNNALALPGYVAPVIVDCNVNSKHSGLYFS